MARNETLFREVNERIEEVNEAFGLDDGPVDFLCECGDDACTAPINLTLREYEDLRSEPTHFAVVPGHEIAGVERVVARNERYAVVEKLAGPAARVAEQHDPRS